MRPLSAVPRLVREVPRALPAPRPPADLPDSAVRRRIPAPYAMPSRVAASPDVEVSMRVYADGTQITVMRRIAADKAGVPQTVGIEAVIR